MVQVEPGNLPGVDIDVGANASAEAGDRYLGDGFFPISLLVRAHPSVSWLGR